MNRFDMTLQHAGWGRLESVFCSVRELWLAAHRAWNAERARSELRVLSDRTLRDIGLNRAQIDNLFR